MDGEGLVGPGGEEEHLAGGGEGQEALGRAVEVGYPFVLQAYDTKAVLQGIINEHLFAIADAGRDDDGSLIGTALQELVVEGCVVLA